MSTTQRLGIDIVGTDKTRAAFMSAQRSLGAFSKTIAFATGALAGLAGGNLLKNVIQSFIQINRHVEPVKTSFQQIDRAWQQFALNVGKGGLNDALINFNERVATMIIRLKGLSGIIGDFLGGGIDNLTNAFTTAGRAIAFVADNLNAANEAFKTFTSFDFKNPVFFDKPVFDLKGFGIDVMRSMGMQVNSLTEDFSNNQAALAKLPKTFKEIEDATKKGAPALEAYRRGMVDLKQYVVGLGDQAANLGKSEGALARLTQSQEIYNKMQDRGVVLIKGQKEAIEQWLDKIPDAVDALARQKDALQTATAIGDTFKSTFSSAFASIVDGTSSVKKAFQSMASSLLSQLTTMFANKAFAMLIEGGPTAGGKGGLVGALFKSFAGGFASGGTLGAGKWGIAGENGPEPIVGPATVIPSRPSGAFKLTIINNNGSQITTREKSNGNGDREIIAMVDSRVAQQMSDPYARSASALKARGARPPLKQR